MAIGLVRQPPQPMRWAIQQPSIVTSMEIGEEQKNPAEIIWVISTLDIGTTSVTQSVPHPPRLTTWGILRQPTRIDMDRRKVDQPPQQTIWEIELQSSEAITQILPSGRGNLLGPYSNTMKSHCRWWQWDFIVFTGLSRKRWKKMWGFSYAIPARRCVARCCGVQPAWRRQASCPRAVWHLELGQSVLNHDEVGMVYGCYPDSRSRDRL